MQDEYKHLHAVCEAASLCQSWTYHADHKLLHAG